jgi:type I restriction enzyme S subunit
MKHKWEFKKLASVCDRIGDGLHGTPLYVPDGKYFFINGNNLKGGLITINENTKTVGQSEFDAHRVALSEATLLLSINGTIGEMALYAGEPVVLGKSAAYINCRDIDRLFCFYYFQLRGVQNAFYNIAHGSTIKNLGLDALKNFMVPVPPLDAQKELVRVLAVIDSKIEINNRINEELEGMAKLLYDYWFVQFDFPISAAQAAEMGDPSLEGKPYRASGGKMVYNEILKREIPAEWSDGSLDALGRVVGGSTPSTGKSEFFDKEGTPWITPKDLSDNGSNRFISNGATGVTSEGIKAGALKIMPAGTVLMSSRAPIGYLAIARNPVTTNQGFKSFVPDKSFSSDYIFFTLKHFMKLIVANASGSTFKEISGGTLKAVRIHIPSPDVVAKYSEIVSSFSDQQDLLERQNKELADLRDWLLPMLMNGQVTVGLASVENDFRSVR